MRENDSPDMACPNRSRPGLARDDLRSRLPWRAVSSRLIQPAYCTYTLLHISVKSDSRVYSNICPPTTENATMSALDHTQHESTNVSGFYSWTDTLEGIYCACNPYAKHPNTHLLERVQMGPDLSKQRSRSCSRLSERSVLLSSRASPCSRRYRQSCPL
jgi:hypothetical protein